MQFVTLPIVRLGAFRGPKVFPVYLFSLRFLRALSMIRSGTSPKKCSAVGLTQCSNTWRTVRRSSMRRMYAYEENVERPPAEAGEDDLVSPRGVREGHYFIRDVREPSTVYVAMPLVSSIQRFLECLLGLLHAPFGSHPPRSNRGGSYATLSCAQPRGSYATLSCAHYRTGRSIMSL